MSGDDAVSVVDQDRVGEAEALDASGDLLDLLSRMGSGVATIGAQVGGRKQLHRRRQGRGVHGNVRAGGDDVGSADCSTPTQARQTRWHASAPFRLSRAIRPPQRSRTPGVNRRHRREERIRTTDPAATCPTSNSTSWVIRPGSQFSQRLRIRTNTAAITRQNRPTTNPWFGQRLDRGAQGLTTSINRLPYRSVP